MASWFGEDLSFPKLTVIDYAIADAPTPDADQTPVPSFDEILEQTRARNAAAYEAAKHAGGDAVLSDEPPVGELAHAEAATKPQGYGVGGFGRPRW